jgi:hypothetical protein
MEQYRSVWIELFFFDAALRDKSAVAKLIIRHKKKSSGLFRLKTFFYGVVRSRFLRPGGAPGYGLFNRKIRPGRTARVFKRPGAGRTIRRRDAARS